MPYHVFLDTAGEAKLGSLSIGTTRRGIGPCYADKSSRLGIRVQDLLDEKILRKKIMAAMEPKRQLLRPHAKDPALDLHAMTEEYITYGHRLEPHIADTAHLCWDALDAGRSVLFEGAQGSLLDLDHGTYPFVTSSNPVAGSACVGAGVGPRDIDEVWGIAKAYSTRVGSGPFPTELDDEVGERLRERRRRGRHDDGAPAALRLARPRRAQVRGPPQRDDRPRDHQARRALRDRPAAASPSATAIPRARASTSSPTTSRCCITPSPSTTSCRAGRRTSAGPAPRTDLPEAARDYLRYISDFVGVPITLVGVGPGREQVIWVGDEQPSRAARRPERVPARQGRKTRMKFIYKPFAIIVGLIAGMLGKKVFEQVWGMVADDDPRDPDDRDATWARGPGLGRDRRRDPEGRAGAGPPWRRQGLRARHRLLARRRARGLMAAWGATGSASSSGSRPKAASPTSSLI